MPNALSRFRDRVSDGLNSPSGLKSITFPNTGGSSSFGSSFGGSGIGYLGARLPGANLDYKSLAGEPHLNSIVGICLNWYINTIHAAPACVKERPKVGDKKKIVPAHPLTRLLLRPNAQYAGSTLWAGTILSYRTRGNAYWFKVRDTAGRVCELWYVPHFQVRPVWEGGDFITAYEYRVNSQVMRMKPEDVIHFRFGIDPFNIRMGLDPLGAVSRSLVQKNGVDTYGVALVRNGAVPSAVITPKDPNQVFDNPALIKAAIEGYTSGDNVGKLLALESAIDLQKLGYTPEELALDTLDAIPTTLISAAMGLDPMVVGLPSASKTYDNYSEAREGAWEQSVIPMHANFGETLDIQLMGDEIQSRPGEAPINPATQTVEWDYSDVSALSEDADSLHARYREDYKARLLDRAQALTGISIEPAKEDAGVFYTGPAGQGESAASLPPPATVKSAKDVTWITVNGHHIPIGEDGKPMTGGEASAAIG